MKNENDKGTLQGHTPGPWVYEGTMNGRQILVGPQRYWTYNGKEEPCCMQRGQEIAVVTMKESIEVAGRPDPVARANARLIAAAPELLQACQMLLIRLEDMPGLPKGGVYDFARAAIAKAKGGAS